MGKPQSIADKFSANSSKLQQEHICASSEGAAPSEKLDLALMESVNSLRLSVQQQLMKNDPNWPAKWSEFCGQYNEAMSNATETANELVSDVIKDVESLCSPDAARLLLDSLRFSIAFERVFGPSEGHLYRDVLTGFLHGKITVDYKGKYPDGELIQVTLLDD